jgi:two-component system, OmpR family, KDP operon response regulator KdpE
MDDFHELIQFGLRPKVLLLCDRPAELARWEQSLPANLLDLILASSLEEAFAHWPENNLDLIIVDVNDARPDCSETCQLLRQESDVPLVVLFAQAGEDCLLRAYKAGADDCLLKPVSLEVLLAKLNAWLHRSWVVPVSVLPDLEASGLRLIPQRHEVIVEGRRAVPLTNLEFRLLTLLMSNAGWTLETEDILTRVWGYGGGSRAGLKNAIRRLRKKIEPDPANPVYLLTDPGHGYRFRDR